MRESKVPIDTSSELKNLMGIVSTRQAIYIGVGGSIVYSYIAPTWNLLYGIFGLIPTLIICLLLASPIIALVIFLGFVPVEKYHMNRDQFWLIKLQRSKYIGLWRKGK